jgi:hypothetical protein
MRCGGVRRPNGFRIAHLPAHSNHVYITCEFQISDRNIDFLAWDKVTNPKAYHKMETSYIGYLKFPYAGSCRERARKIVPLVIAYAEDKRRYAM